MGSTFKVLNTAIALESGTATTKQRFEVSKPLQVSRFTITDYHPHKKPLNVPEILVYSSNIGSALIAEAISAKTQRAYMDKLGCSTGLTRNSRNFPSAIAKTLAPYSTLPFHTATAFQFRQPRQCGCRRIWNRNMDSTNPAKAPNQ